MSSDTPVESLKPQTDLLSGDVEDDPVHDMGGTFAPLRYRYYAALWIATIAANFGAIIQTMAAAWLMTSLTAESSMVALVQTASSAPVMALALFAGALADRFGRKRQMLLAQIFAFAASGTLAALAYLDAVTPWSLLLFTFLVGVANAAYLPAWQSSMADHLPREQIPAAIGLNAVAFNLARCIAPAIGGAVLVSSGASTAFLINMLSSIGLIAILPLWRNDAIAPAIAAEPLLPSIRSGLTYIFLHAQMRASLLRCTGFAFAASATFAFLPLIARDIIGGGVNSYSIALTAYGLGAMTAGMSVTGFRKRFGFQATAVGAGIMSAVASIGIGLHPAFPIVFLALFAAGAGWVLSFTSYNVAMQALSPDWLMGRTVACYQTAVFTGMAAGSAFWGVIATHVGVSRTLVAAGLFLIAMLIMLRRRASMSQKDDHGQAALRPHDIRKPALELAESDGPIVTEITYEVASHNVGRFTDLMEQVGLYRRRNGARRWLLRQDLDAPDRWVESFWASSWADQQRRAARTTGEIEELRTQILSLNRASADPHIRRWLVRRQAGG